MKDSPGIALDRKTRVGTIRHGSNSVWNIAKSPSLKSLRQHQRLDLISPYYRAGSLSRSTSSTSINGFLDESFESTASSTNGGLPRSFSDLSSIPRTPRLLSPGGSPGRRRSSMVPSGSFVGLSQLLEDASEGDTSTSSIFPKAPFQTSSFRNSSSPLNSHNGSILESSSSPQSILTVEPSEQDNSLLHASFTPLLVLDQGPFEPSLKRKYAEDAEMPSFYGHSRSSSLMSNSKTSSSFPVSLYQRNKRPKFEVTEREIKSINNVAQNEPNKGFFTASFDALEAEAQAKKPMLLTYHEPKQKATPIAKVSAEPKSTSSARKLFSHTPSFLSRYTDLRKVGNKFFPLHVKPRDEMADVKKKREELLEHRRLEAERLRKEEEERIFREQERIRLEREERERKEREERERQERLRREQEERERLERERKAREEREKREREEKERREREEKERRERELEEKKKREQQEREEKAKLLEEEEKQKSGQITPQPLDSSSSTPLFTFGAPKAPSTDTKESTDDSKKPLFSLGTTSTADAKPETKDAQPKSLFGKPSEDSSKPSTPLFGQPASALGDATTQKPLAGDSDPKPLFGTPASSTQSTPKLESTAKPKFSFNFNSGAGANPSNATSTSGFSGAALNATTAGASGSGTSGFSLTNNNNAGSSASGFNFNNSTNTSGFAFNGSNAGGGFKFNGSTQAPPANNSFKFSPAPSSSSTFKLSSAPASFDFNAMSGGNGGGGGFTFGGSTPSAPTFTGGNAFGNNSMQNGAPQAFSFNGQSSSSPSQQSFVFTGQTGVNPSQPPPGRKVLPIRRRIRPN